MSLQYAILAGLAQSPRTGYELSKGLQGSIGFFWHATHQQIYRELERLHQQAWVKVTVEPQPGKPDRKIYTLTAAGQKALRQWIETPTDTEPNRRPLLVKLFVGHLADRPKLIAELERELKAHEQRLAEYRDIENRFFSGRDLPTHLRFQHYALQYGLKHEEFWLNWCQAVIEDLRAHAAD